MLSKKYLLWASGFIAALLLVGNWVGTFRLCGGTEYGQCMDVLYSTVVNFFPIIAVFLITLIIYWMRDEIYQAWFRFARWYVPIAMLLILITPEYGGGLFNPVQKGSVAFVLTALFFVVSLLLIAVKHFRQR
ncbi:MAG: hypothetical protein Q8R25_03345 [bacterium]|nr:hypothetical protein [bacterium]